MAMNILVVGSVAFDAVKTPFGAVERMLGGSATYFSLAASFFAGLRVVAVVGDDFTDAEMAVFREKNISTAGLERAPGRTFFWSGEYTDNLNDRVTLDTQLNVFADFQPKIPAEYRDSELLFLGNIDPELQRNVQAQLSAPRLVAGDTMNFWIQGKPEALRRTLGGLHVLVINDGEARLLSGEYNLPAAARSIHAMGPRILVIKRGEYGALLFVDGKVFCAPGFLLEQVCDPTGAGDSFAGGFMGALAEAGGFDQAALRRAMIYGSVLGSFAVERFGVERLRRLTRQEIDARYCAIQDLVRF
jgi:sugar/nucleoside kinase (ribokinase family)